MEYYKTYCSSHPYEAITNFCADCKCWVMQLTVLLGYARLASASIRSSI